MVIAESRTYSQESEEDTQAKSGGEELGEYLVLMCIGYVVWGMWYGVWGISKYMYSITVVHFSEPEFIS